MHRHRRRHKAHHCWVVEPAARVRIILDWIAHCMPSMFVPQAACNTNSSWSAGTCQIRKAQTALHQTLPARRPAMTSQSTTWNMCKQTKCSNVTHSGYDGNPLSVPTHRITFAPGPWNATALGCNCCSSAAIGSAVPFGYPPSNHTSASSPADTHILTAQCTTSNHLRV
jgi:hypothetical protein